MARRRRSLLLLFSLSFQVGSRVPDVIVAESPTSKFLPQVSTTSSPPLLLLSLSPLVYLSFRHLRRQPCLLSIGSGSFVKGDNAGGGDEEETAARGEGRRSDTRGRKLREIRLEAEDQSQPACLQTQQQETQTHATTTIKGSQLHQPTCSKRFKVQPYLLRASL